MPKVTRYVAGFLFDPEELFVVLIEKQRPEFMRGRLNAVGGHIEPGESPEEAMRREFREETGLDIGGWEHFATLRSKGFEVVFFRAEDPDQDVTTTTDEPVGVYYVPHMDLLGTMNNLLWLIQMAKSRCRKDWPYVITERAPSTEVA